MNEAMSIDRFTIRAADETEIVALRTPEAVLWWAPHLGFWCRLPKSVDASDRDAIKEAVRVELAKHEALHQRSLKRCGSGDGRPRPPPGPYRVRVRSGSMPESFFAAPRAWGAVAGGAA